MICIKFKQITPKDTECNKRCAGLHRASTTQNTRLCTLSEFVKLKGLGEGVRRQ